MNAKLLMVAASSALILATSACNAPITQSSSVQPSDLALTITAQALIIQGAPSQAGAAQTKSTRTPHSRMTATDSLTPTPGVALVSVSKPTNCRAGPSTDYDLVSTLDVGKTAEVVGKDKKDNYWIIKTPGGSGRCWLWGQYATVTGDTSNLPEIKPPPTPVPTDTHTPLVPAAPKNVHVAKICVPIPVPVMMYQYQGTLSWDDVAKNEDGYHVYLGGSLLSTLGPDVTSFPVPVELLPPGTSLSMGVDAFNATGKSATKSVSIVCP